MLYPARVKRKVYIYIYIYIYIIIIIIIITTTTLSRRLTMHLNDSNSIALHFKSHSLANSKVRKIIVENITIMAHEISKLRLQILEAPHIETKHE